MMKSITFATVLAGATLMTGCASTSDVDNLQSQIDALKSQISTASTDAARAQSAASEAAAKASAAEAAANRAAQYAQDTNRKLDRMFKKSMMK